MTFPVERPLLLAIVAHLNSVLGANRAGYGERPSAGGWQGGGTPVPGVSVFNGYAVVWGGMTTTDGPMLTPDADGSQGFMVMSVGQRGEQADAIRDRCRAALLVRGAIVVGGGRIVDRIDFGSGTVTSRDDDVQPPLFYGSDYFTAYTTPA